MSAVDRMADMNRRRAESDALKADMNLVAEAFGCTDAEVLEMWQAAQRDRENARTCFATMARVLRPEDGINERIRRERPYKPVTPEQDRQYRQERARLDREEAEKRAA